MKTSRPPFIILLLLVSFSARSRSWAVECLPPPTGIVGWWKGENSANDSSAVPKDATAVNTTYAAGFVGSSFQLNGRDSAITVPASPQLNVKSFTFAAWINPTGSGPQPVFEFSDDFDVAGVH